MATAAPAFATGGQVAQGAYQAAASLRIQGPAGSAGTSAGACAVGHAPKIAFGPRTVWIYAQPRTVWIYAQPRKAAVYARPQTVWIYVVPNKTLTTSAGAGWLPSAAPAPSGARAACVGPARGR